MCASGAETLGDYGALRHSFNIVVDAGSVDDAMDDTEEVVGKGIEAGADAVEKGIGTIKGWMKKDGD